MQNNYYEPPRLYLLKLTEIKINTKYVNRHTNKINEISVNISPPLTVILQILIILRNK